MLRLGRRDEPTILFEPLGGDDPARELPVLDFQRSTDGSTWEPPYGTIRVRLDGDDACRWALGLGGTWRVHYRSRCRLMHLNGPLATASMPGAEIQTWRWEDVAPSA